jgi:hypothetical protein
VKKFLSSPDVCIIAGFHMGMLALALLLGCNSFHLPDATGPAKPAIAPDCGWCIYGGACGYCDSDMKKCADGSVVLKTGSCPLDEDKPPVVDSKGWAEWHIDPPLPGGTPIIESKGSPAGKELWNEGDTISTGGEQTPPVKPSEQGFSKGTDTPPKGWALLLGDYHEDPTKPAPDSASIENETQKVVMLGYEEYSHLRSLRQAVVDEEKRLAVKYGANPGHQICDMTCVAIQLPDHYEFHGQFLLIDKVAPEQTKGEPK